MKPILEIKNISKAYRLQHERKPYLSLRDSLAGFFSARGRNSEMFRALDNVTFNVEPGETLGIIGRNGAGKSTLLKILSRITPPTLGSITVRGRIASLLEVGTGFHPELTGRENIFLNGSILGMKRSEILSSFDEIVDFSGTEKFLDTPLKHFSSGMQLRLAFSVAAFLQPEILVIDEVLAVGDNEFQKKCIGKMEGVAKSGRTILFVSHNLGAVKQLCTKTLFLEAGKIKAIGATDEIIPQYLNSEKRDKSKVSVTDLKNIFLSGFSIELLDPVEGDFAAHFDAPLRLRLELTAIQDMPHCSIGLGAMTMDNTPMFTVRAPQNITIGKGKTISTEIVINHNLRAGLYTLSVGLANGTFNYYHNSSCAQLEILGYGKRDYLQNNYGLIDVDSDWKIHN